MREIKNMMKPDIYNEEVEQKRVQAKFNSITEKNKPENQNQTHNTRKEGINPINQKR